MEAPPGVKLILLFAVVAVVCLALFLTGVGSPRRSRNMQQATDELAAKGEAKGEQKGGKMGDVARHALVKSRRAADRSASKGREVNRRVGKGADGAGDV